MPIQKPMQSKIFADTDATSAFVRFVVQAQLIRKGWSRRKRAARSRTPRLPGFHETPDDWMLRHSYRLIGELIKAGYSHLLDARIQELHIRHAGRFSLEGQPFKKGLLAMFGWEVNPPSGVLMKRQRRSELGNAMAYAFRHGVHPKYLCGFIKQAGLKLIAEKLKIDYREPGFASESRSARTSTHSATQ